MGSTFTVKDVAERYGVGVRTVISWVRSGQLVALSVSRKLGSKKPRLRVSETSLAAFEALRSVTPAVTPVRRRKHRQPGTVIEFYPAR